MSVPSSSQGSHSGTAISPIFATTHWSVVLNAVEGNSPQAATALEQLCRAYWYPLYRTSAAAIRRKTRKISRKPSLPTCWRENRWLRGTAKGPLSLETG